ncbi:MAG: B12-binding domain-containing radical SAM protein [Chloroflexi bacterium]|nr:B12-binding domain-containing radical SAM protein [Chloroflexota bacterium]
MKILFVIHDLDFADHMAIAYLSAVAKQINHQTFFCSLDRNDLIASVKEVSPDIVAYSVNIIGFKKIMQANREAIKIHKFISIMGGPHPTISPETFTESGMDAYCIGEGEYPFRDFLLRVEAGNPYDDVANLITKNRVNPVRPLITNLDELPPADRDLVISNSHLKYAAKKTFYVTRGCPFSCAYCCNNYYHKLYRGKGAAVRRFSVERTLREIEDVGSKYRMDFVKFGDDCFAFKADEWLEEFSENYPQRVGVPFNCYLRLDTVDDAMLRLLKKAGCFSVHLSVDSTSRHVRENILKRQMRNENIEEKLRKIKDYGINTWVNYMLAAPESTLQDDLETIKMSKRARVTYPSYTITVPMEKTDLYDYCVEHSLIDPSTYLGDMSGLAKKSVLSCFTEKEKNIRFNIFLLGAWLAKLPFPVDRVALLLIKAIPPNKFFRKMYEFLFEYYVERKIFKLKKDNLRGKRFLDYGNNEAVNNG